MTAPEFANAVWRKSTRSNGTGQCVEVAVLGEAIAVRDSKNPEGHVLLLRPANWSRFLVNVKSGMFDPQ
ncbi:DUF397 domain-containing protein [Cryptosporangium sp. NPDC051539]|uniref:DUF397 domain-containing protein n=1 Tax=Cryptosporangium sp. NPDC051539 TaxID=3363962 RepID=UPI0037893524